MLRRLSAWWANTWLGQRQPISLGTMALPRAACFAWSEKPAGGYDIRVSVKRRLHGWLNSMRQAQHKHKLRNSWAKAQARCGIAYIALDSQERFDETRDVQRDALARSCLTSVCSFGGSRRPM
jgi:hypothetical protein